MLDTGPSFIVFMQSSPKFNVTCFVLSVLRRRIAAQFFTRFSTACYHNLLT